MLSEDELVTRQAYDQLSTAYAEAFPDLSAETASDHSVIESFAARVSRTGPVLDVGCGTGRVAAHLESFGLTPVGLDLSSGMLAKARLLHPGLPVVVGSLVRLPFADASASGVLAWYSLIHTAPDELPVVVAELARVLKAGAPVLAAFQCGQGERVERTSTFGIDVLRINYRHEVDRVVEAFERHGVSVAQRLVRDAEGSHEATPQAFLLGAREPTG